MDYYSILGVDRSASQEDLKKAYKKASMQHHPDRGGSEAKFKEINEAYSTLKDPDKRHLYDNPQPQMNHMHFQNGGFTGGFDINDLMGQFGFRQQQRGNPDINIACTITLEEALQGKTVRATYSLRNGQSETVDIEIPPGADNGNNIRYQGLGENMLPGPRGSLQVKVRVSRHPRFERDGQNLILKHQVNVFDLLLGCQHEITTLEGSTIRLTIPKATKPGVTFSVNGYGMPDVRTGRKGNLYVLIEAIVPKIDDPIDLVKLKELKDKTVK